MDWYVLNWAETLMLCGTLLWVMVLGFLLGLSTGRREQRASGRSDVASATCTHSQLLQHSIWCPTCQTNVSFRDLAGREWNSGAASSAPTGGRLTRR